MNELRTQYLAGRAWLKLGFQSVAGERIDLSLVVDTGSPYGIILGADLFDKLIHSELTPVLGSTGLMPGGWFQLYMPELHLAEKVRGYENQMFAMSVFLDDPSFMGVVGLPILRLGEYGGNAADFWFRYPAP